MEIYVDDQFMSVFEKSGTLNLCWKKYTTNLTDEKFKEEALKFVDAIRKRKSKKIIVDMRKFNFNISDNLIAWRNEHVISVYNEIKVEKFAFISEKKTVNQDNPDNTFITQYFLTEQEANNWLNS